MKKSLSPSGIQTPYSPARSLGTTLTELSRIHCCIRS